MNQKKFMALYKNNHYLNNKLGKSSLFSPKSWNYFSIFAFIIFALFVLFITTSSAAERPKFLIIHLDALSSPNFFQYMEDGYLPNIKAVFNDGHIIPYGLSLYPGGTETIVPRIREGLDNSTGAVGWEYYDRDKEKVIPQINTFCHMFSRIPRRARAGIIYGIPFLDIFNFMPMVNIPGLLEKYHVIQFYWFATDSLGHQFGEDLYLSSTRRFDRYFGKLISKLNLDETNIIIYADHGMAFGEFVDPSQTEQIKRVVGENLIAYRHPSIYLKDPEKKDLVAQNLVNDSDIDFAFYRESPNCVIGYSSSGKMIFEARADERIRYLYEGEDTFGYYLEGYQGEWLNHSEWLSKTKENSFPAVPPNIYNLLLNKQAGDVIMVINPPKIPRFNLIYPASHCGLTGKDLMVPILLLGNELEHLYDREEIWLHELLISIPALDFDNTEPEREVNSLSSWGGIKDGQHPGFELSLSPAYRWNIVGQYKDNTYKGWFEYDVYSSYVIRLWTGAGLEYQDRNYEPFLHTRLQMDFDRIRFNYGVQSHLFDLKNWEENRKELIFKVNNKLSFNWQIPNRIGFSIYW